MAVVCASNTCAEEKKASKYSSMKMPSLIDLGAAAVDQPPIRAETLDPVEVHVVSVAGSGAQGEGSRGDAVRPTAGKGISTERWHVRRGAGAVRQGAAVKFLL
jgi:hypothetical protein